MHLTLTRLLSIGFLVCMVLGQDPEGLKPFFTWERPRFVAARLPIRKSATCRFKQSLIAQFLDSHPDGHLQVQYASAIGDEADTVSFVDLDTSIPKVVSNGGQAVLQVLYRNGSEISLLNRRGLTPGIGQGTEVYTIFTDSGVILHATQHRLLRVPSGVTEMGYCN
jgi:hypothetical protein